MDNDNERDKEQIAGTQARHKALQDWITSEESGDYQALHKHLEEARQLFLEEVAWRLEGPLNREAKNRPHSTYDDKKELSKWLNQQLKDLSLTFVCPRTGRPAFISGTTSRGHNLKGRFAFISVNESGVRVPSATSTLLPLLKVLPLPPDRHTNLWTDKIRRPDSGERDLP